MLNDYFGAMSEVISRHGGVITHFEGDLMLITFNAVTPDEDHPASALQTALGIQKIVNSRTFGKGATLKTRCGINTGEIVIGAVGTKDRLVFTVHGDNVNVAARLEQMNKEYGTYILVSENTMVACRDKCEFEPVCEVAVRGREAATKVYTVKA